MVMDLNPNATELEVLVKIRKPGNNSNETITWCDDMKVFIIYGTDSEYLQGKNDMRYFARNVH